MGAREATLEAQPAEDEAANASWQTAHAALSRLARQRCAAEAEEGRWLLRAYRAAAHVYLGFGSFTEYVERLFGYQARSTRERLRVTEALEQLPALRQALEQGELSWLAVRELTRVAVSETEQQWLELGRGKTVRQLEELVAGKHCGEEPSAPPDPRARRQVLRFEVEAETFASFREALAELRRRGGAPGDDDSALLEMARRVLAGPREEGRSSYQVVVSVCPACGAGRQLSSGELVPVAPEIAELACCDGQHVRHVAGESEAEATSPAGGEPQSAEALVTSTVDAADVHLRGDTADVAHVGAAERPVAAPQHRPRARQSIPPALRRAVLLRDRHRCRVPGCRHASYVDLHHIQLRSEGGQNHPENLLVVCGSHHRALHSGALVVEGRVSAPVFRHADGTAYGQRLEPSAVEAQTQVFQALRGLGFREGEVRAVLVELQRDNEPEHRARAAAAARSSGANPVGCEQRNHRQGLKESVRRCCRASRRSPCARRNREKRRTQKDAVLVRRQGSSSRR